VVTSKVFEPSASPSAAVVSVTVTSVGIFLISGDLQEGQETLLGQSWKPSGIVLVRVYCGA
jgi:hypothetical protein